QSFVQHGGLSGEKLEKSCNIVESPEPDELARHYLRRESRLPRAFCAQAPARIRPPCGRPPDILQACFGETMPALLDAWRHTPTHRKVWALAAPMILSNLSVPLVTLVDTAVIGHLPHAHQLAAVVVGGSLY